MSIGFAIVSVACGVLVKGSTVLGTVTWIRHQQVTGYSYCGMQVPMGISRGLYNLAAKTYFPNYSTVFCSMEYIFQIQDWRIDAQMKFQCIELPCCRLRCSTLLLIFSMAKSKAKCTDTSSTKSTTPLHL